MSQRGWRTLGEHEPQNQLNKAHMSSQRQQQQVQGLHGSTPSPTGLCYSYWLRVFMEFLTEWICLWQLGLLLGFSCSVVFNIYMKFITLYFILSKVKTKPYLQLKREKRKSKNSASTASFAYRSQLRFLQYCSGSGFLLTVADREQNFMINRFPCCSKAEQATILIKCCLRVDHTPHTTPGWQWTQIQHTLGLFNYSLASMPAQAGLFGFDNGSIKIAKLKVSTSLAGLAFFSIIDSSGSYGHCTLFFNDLWDRGVGIIA